MLWVWTALLCSKGKSSCAFVSSLVSINSIRRKGSTWIYALKCLSLPPDVRTKKQNLVLLGMLSGVIENPSSLLLPLVQELEVFQVTVKLNLFLFIYY